MSPMTKNTDEADAHELPCTSLVYTSIVDEFSDLKRNPRLKPHVLTPTSSINSDTTRVDPKGFTEIEWSKPTSVLENPSLSRFLLVSDSG